MRSRSFLLILLSGFSSLCSHAQEPPVAPVVEHHETRYGAVVSDDYFWLRDKSNPQVIPTLTAENAYTDAMTET